MELYDKSTTNPRLFYIMSTTDQKFTTKLLIQNIHKLLYDKTMHHDISNKLSLTITVGERRQQVKRNAAGSGALSEYCDTIRVSSERDDVVTDPAKSSCLVVKSHVPAYRAIGRRQKTCWEWSRTQLIASSTNQRWKIEQFDRKNISSHD